MKKLEYERAPSPLVLQDQWIQDVAAADTSPPDKTEMPAVIQHIVEVVLHHQPATPQALHGIPLSDRLDLVTSIRREIRKPDARPQT